MANIKRVFILFITAVIFVECHRVMSNNELGTRLFLTEKAIQPLQFGESIWRQLRSKYKLSEESEKKRSSSYLDVDQLLYDPELFEHEGNPDEKDFPHKNKDEMSNHIPYANEPNERTRMQTIADSMMEEFLTYIFLKDLGVLDRCLGTRR